MPISLLKFACFSIFLSGNRRIKLADPTLENPPRPTSHGSTVLTLSLRTSLNHDSRGRTKQSVGPVSLGQANTSRKANKGKAGRLGLQLKLQTLPPAALVAVLHRPGLGRSKSTDGLLRSKVRSNRLFTKLSTVHPLTKTLSGGTLAHISLLAAAAVAQAAHSGHAKLRLTLSLKALAESPLAPIIGLKLSSRKGKAILRLNDDAEDDEYEDVDLVAEDELSRHGSVSQVKPNHTTTDISLHSIDCPPSQQPSRIKLPSLDCSVSQEHYTEPSKQGIEVRKPRHSAEPRQNVHTSLIRSQSPFSRSLEVQVSLRTLSSLPGLELLRQPLVRLHLRHQNVGVELPPRDPGDASGSRSTRSHHHSDRSYSRALLPHEHSVSTRSSTDDLMSGAAYGGSMLLSQSTGLTRKVNPGSSTGHSGSGVHDGGDQLIPESSGSVMAAQSSPQEGILFKASGETHANAKSDGPTTRGRKGHYGYQEKNSAPFSSQPRPDANFSNNFAQFLNLDATGTSQGQHPLLVETRTQQRLWLQRENSLMDVPHLDANNLNNFSNLSLSNLMFSHNQSSTNMQQMAANAGFSRDGAYTSLGRDSTRGSFQGSGGVTPQGYEGSGDPSVNNVQLQFTGALATPSVERQLVYGGTDGTSTPGGEALNLNTFLRLVLSSSNHRVSQKMEFERLNREYLNLRRYRNPVAELLDRIADLEHVDQIKIKKTRDISKKKESGLATVRGSTGAVSNNAESDTAIERDTEAQALVSKLWQDAISSKASQLTPHNQGYAGPAQPPKLARAPLGLQLQQQRTAVYNGTTAPRPQNYHHPQTMTRAPSLKMKRLDMLVNL